MATRVDALRSTLDQLALDPRAQEDRPYLITMLRRLGYSDVEIQAALGPIEEPEPEAAPEPEPVRQPARSDQGAVDTRPRVIEVEYTGPDFSEEFQRVGPDGRPIEGGSTQFSVGQGEDGEEIFEGEEGELGYEGEGEDFGDFDMAAVDAVEDTWDDDWGEGEFGSALEAREGEGPEDMSEDERRKLLEELGLDPDDDSIADFGTRPKTSYNKPKRGSTRLMEFQEFQPHEAEGRMAAEDADELPWAGSEAYEGDAAEFGGTDEGLPEFGGSGDDPPGPDATDVPAFEAEEAWEPEEASPWEPAAEDPGALWEGEQEAWPESDEDVPAAPEAAYTYRDYTLYTRDVELSTGRSQRIYFFAKNEPKNGEPSPLPEGYEVKENEQTGLPFLRRAAAEPVHDEPAWRPAEPVDDAATEDAPPEPAGKKRVRAVRVKARSREEAEEQMRQQGKDVRGSVPIEFDDGDA